MDEAGMGLRWMSLIAHRENVIVVVMLVRFPEGYLQWFM
jgi:hypothetical protein